MLGEEENAKNEFETTTGQLSGNCEYSRLPNKTHTFT